MSMPQPSASLRVEPCREPTSLRAIRRVPQCTLRMRGPSIRRVPCGSPEGDVGSLGGRAAAAASVGRFSPSTPQAGSDGWRARAFGEPAGLEIPTW